MPRAGTWPRSTRHRRRTATHPPSRCRSTARAGRLRPWHHRSRPRPHRRERPPRNAGGFPRWLPRLRNAAIFFSGRPGEDRRSRGHGRVLRLGRGLAGCRLRDAASWSSEPIPGSSRGRGVVTAASYAARRYASGPPCRSRAPGAWRRRRAAGASRRRSSSVTITRSRTGKSRSTECGGASRPPATPCRARGDKAYLELSSLGSFEAASERARLLKAEIVGREGLTASVGVGPNNRVGQDRVRFPEAGRPRRIRACGREEVQ